MANNPSTLPDYNGQVNPPDAEYPYGSARDDVTPGDLSGTPRVAAELKDLQGFQQALLVDAGIVPSGNADKVGASQYLEAIKKLGIFAAVSTFATVADLEAGNLIGGGSAKFAELAANGGIVQTKANAAGLVDGSAFYEIMTAAAYGGTPDGFGDRYVDGGTDYVARLIILPTMSAASWGVNPSNADNSVNYQAIVNSLKAGGCHTVTNPSGTLNFKCFDELTRGRAAFETRDLANVDFVGGVATKFKAVVGGFGTDPFGLVRVDNNTKNVRFIGIEFDGDYSNVPEFQGQTANRSNGVIIAGWDFADSGQTSYDDFSIDGVEIIGCRFVNIGGGVSTQRKSALTQRGAYTTVTVHNCTFIDAQQSSNSIGADYAYRWTVTKNKMRTTLALSDTIWTLAIDMSRGGIGNEVAYNEVEKYHFGIKAEYFLEGGTGGTDVELSVAVDIHNNRLIDIGHPTIDAIGGPSGSGSYGIRMSGTSIVERDNFVSGLFNAANVGNENRMVFGVWANQVDVAGTQQESNGGLVSNAQTAVNHQSADASNLYACERKKIGDCNQGILLQAGGAAEKNDIRRIKGVGVRLQVVDQTFVKNNYLQDTMQDGGSEAAIYGEPSTGSSVRYWEVMDNEIITVDSGAGTGVIINSGSQYQKEYRYRGGRMVGVAARENLELVSDVLEETPIKARGVLNPSTGGLINTKNVASATQVDANTVEITFLKPMPSSTYTIDAREPNNVGVQWINFGTTTTTLRLRSVDVSNVPVPLPASLMFTVS